MESAAINYDDYSKLKFIVIEKAKQKNSIVKNFIKLEQFQKNKGHLVATKTCKKQKKICFYLVILWLLKYQVFQ